MNLWFFYLSVKAFPNLIPFSYYLLLFLVIYATFWLNWTVLWLLSMLCFFPTSVSLHRLSSTVEIYYLFLFAYWIPTHPLKHSSGAIFSLLNQLVIKNWNCLAYLWWTYICILHVILWQVDNSGDLKDVLIHTSSGRLNVTEKTSYIVNDNIK